VDQAREKTCGDWIKLVRNSPPQVDQAGENSWIMLVGNDRCGGRDEAGELRRERRDGGENLVRRER
jgi:hypothetical protein